MFNIGNKVVITGSSIKKGRTGPKVGSLGYISYVNNTFIDLDLYSIVNASVIFYKFGNEKHYRVERKSIPFIFPKQMETMNDFNFSSQQRFLRKVSKNNKVKQCIKNIFGTKLLYTLSPIYTNRIEMNIEERIAYLKSLWSPINIGQCVENECNAAWHYRYKKPIVKKILFTLSEGLNNIKYKNRFIEDLSKENITKYNSFIKAVKFLNLRYITQRQIGSIYDIQGNYSVQSNADILYKLLYINLFNIRYKTISKKYLSERVHGVNKQEVKTIINHLNYAKHRIINIGQKYS